MKRWIGLGAFLLAWGVSQPAAQAAPPWTLFDGHNWSFPRSGDLWGQRTCWCPDDYCPKPLPCVIPTATGFVDDYCPKTLPCVPSTPKGCVDDYCPKTCPIILESNCQPWYICGPPETCSKCSCGKSRQ
jgi:hypothetical protein